MNNLINFVYYIYNMNDILSKEELYLTQKYIKRYGMKYVFWINKLGAKK